MRTLHRLIFLLSACASLPAYALLSGCASHGVHCDGRLQPINAPRAAGDVTPPRAP